MNILSCWIGKIRAHWPNVSPKDCIRAFMSWSTVLYVATSKPNMKSPTPIFLFGYILSMMSRDDHCIRYPVSSSQISFLRRIHSRHTLWDWSTSNSKTLSRWWFCVDQVWLQWSQRFSAREPVVWSTNRTARCKAVFVQTGPRFLLRA